MRTLETERLVLRPLAQHDLEFLTELHADPEVARYLSTGRPRTPEESALWLALMLAQERTTGFSHLCIVRREDERRLGRCGLSPFELAPPAEPGGAARGFFGRGGAADGGVAGPVEVVAELGYSLERSAWGKGYASEAARAVRDHALGELGMPRLMSIIHPDNARSARVARGLGLAREGDVDVFGGVYERWGLERGQWLAER